MSCIGQEIVEDASRFPIIDVIDSINIITTTEVLQVCVLYQPEYYNLLFTCDVMSTEMKMCCNLIDTLD